MQPLAVEQASSPGLIRRSPNAALTLWIPLVAYALARVFSGMVIAWASKYQTKTSANSGSTETYQVYRSLPADPGYLGSVTNWDGQWYWRIAETGYTPANVDSSPAAGWAWAFPPGYPTMVSAIMNLTGVSFPVVAASVSTVLGAIAMVVLYRLVEPAAGRLNATGAVLATSCFVSSPLFQVAYSEALGFLLVVMALSLVSREKLGLACFPVLLLCLTRQISPPLALVAIAVMLLRWRRARDSISLADWWGFVVFCAISTFGVLLWPLISTIAGGGAGADRVQATASGSPLGWFGAFADVSWWALSIPFALIIAVILAVVRKHREWGTVLSVWAVAYPLYIMVITPPMTGFTRYLLFAFPLGMLLTGSRRWSLRGRLALLCAGCLTLLVLQVLWIRYSFIYEVVDGKTPLMP